MIEKIKLHNFKCFQKLELELSNLNVFAGMNSVGKSSVIQSLLLLKQSYDMNAINKGLYLNGELVKIGTGFDLLYRSSSEDALTIELSINEKRYAWKFNYEKEADFLKLDNFEGYDVDEMNLFGKTFSYVAAERIGPQSYYEKSYQKIYDHNQVGYKGELFADYLAKKGLEEKISNPYIIHGNTISSLLIYQFDAWMSELCPGIKANPKKYLETGIVGIGYQVQNNEFTPLNVGFGISYVAPILISLLKAKKDDLIILENPEAHLHPKGQRIMGELIAKTCAGGAQVMVETHSDHLLNGIRLSVKNKVVDHNKIRLNYFYTEVIDHTVIHQKCTPAILENGKLSDWPDGFFDEWDKAIEELF